MSHDRAKHNVLPLTKFGLMQITRQRVRMAVEVDVTEVCPTCGGKGKIQASVLFTDSVEEDLRSHAEKGETQGKTLELHPYVYAYVTRGCLHSIKRRWRHLFGVRVKENQSLGMLEYKLK